MEQNNEYTLLEDSSCGTSGCSCGTRPEPNGDNYDGPMYENDRTLTLIVKVTNKCNLDCPYCYNQMKAGWDQVMTLEMVEEIANKFKGHINTWTWHGGEPTLMGIEWYRKAHKIIREICGNVDIAIQTHGGTINQEWIDFYKEEKMHPGLSFDGYNNDLTRKNTRQLLKNMELLRENGIEPSAILVITKDNTDRLNEEYELFKKLKIRGMFNQVFEVHDVDAKAAHNEYIEGSNMALNVCDHFDYWMKDRDNPTDIYLATRYLDMVFESNNTLCEHINCTGLWAAVYPNGDLYPCGRDWLPEAKFGNLSEISNWEEFQQLQKVNKFKEDVKIMLEGNCSTCPWYNSCKGGCYADAWETGVGIKKPQSDSCSATKMILSHIWNRVKDIDIEKDYAMYNPILIRKLQEHGHRSIEFIKDLQSREVN